MRGDQGGNRGRSGPRQRSAAGHEAWLLSGAWNLGLELACNPGLWPFNPGVLAL